MIGIAVPALAMFGLSQTAEADHNCGYGGGYYGGGYGYGVPAYSYAPVYRSAYVQPSYGISIGFGQSYYGGNRGYYGGNRGYYGGYGGHRGGYGGHGGHGHYGGHGGHYGGHHH